MVTKFPIAETFYSIQGEATWAGQPQFFVRLAGCNVGKYYIPEPTKPFRVYQAANPEYSTCTSVAGKSFVCDTDYRVKDQLTIEEILALVPAGVKDVSLTGGEPLIHKHLDALIAAFDNAQIMVHLETSGTIDLSILGARTNSHLWITCSPKQGFLDSNNEFIDDYKFLVEDASDIEFIEDFCIRLGITSSIWIQSIERYDANGPIKTSYDLAVEMVKLHPTWRLSIQMHKVLGVK